MDVEEIVFYPLEDVFSVRSGRRYYFDVKPGNEKKIRSQIRVEGDKEPPTIVVTVEESRTYLIHVTEIENIKFVCHKNYNSKLPFPDTAFVIVKCFPTAITAEYTTAGDEFFLVVPPYHRIRLIRTEDENVNNDDIETLQTYLETGELVSFLHEIHKILLFIGVAPMEEAVLKHPAMVDITVDGVFIKNIEYLHMTDSNQICVKVGHTYNRKVRFNEQVYVYPPSDEPIDPYIVNVDYGNNYVIFVRPVDTLIILGCPPHLARVVTADDMPYANISIKCQLVDAEESLVVNPGDSFKLYLIPHQIVSVRRSDQDPDADIPVREIEVQPGYFYELNLTQNSTLELSGDPVEGVVLNPALISINCPPQSK